MGVEAGAAIAGYRLAQRHLKEQLVWWWQRLDDPDRASRAAWNVVRRSQASVPAS